MKSAAEIVARYLQEEGVGTIGSTIFIDGEPPKPDNTLTIYNTMSDRPRHVGGIENEGYRRQKWRVQIRIRHRDAREAHNWLQQARVALHLLRTKPAGETSFDEPAQWTKGAWLTNGGISLGRDTDNRALVVDNWEVDIEWSRASRYQARITETNILRVTEGDLLRIV